MIGLSALIVSIAILMYVVSKTQSNTSSEDNIIGEPIRIGRLEIAEFDFPKHMYWGDAVDACRALESGWRLPTWYELNFLYKNKDKIGNFAPEGYWSSSIVNNVISEELQEAWVHDFADGDQYLRDRNEKIKLVRAVRSF